MHKNLSNLRDILFETLEGLKNGTIDIDRAKVISEVAKVIIDSAKVEVDYIDTIKLARDVNSKFIENKD